MRALLSLFGQLINNRNTTIHVSFCTQTGTRMRESVACEVVGMRISISKFEIVVLCQERVMSSPSWVWKWLLLIDRSQLKGNLGTMSFGHIPGEVFGTHPTKMRQILDMLERLQPLGGTEEAAGLESLREGTGFNITITQDYESLYPYFKHFFPHLSTKKKSCTTFTFTSIFKLYS